MADQTVRLEIAADGVQTLKKDIADIGQAFIDADEGAEDFKSALRGLRDSALGIKDLKGLIDMSGLSLHELAVKGSAATATLSSLKDALAGLRDARDTGRAQARALGEMGGAARAAASQVAGTVQSLRELGLSEDASAVGAEALTRALRQAVDKMLALREVTVKGSPGFFAEEREGLAMLDRGLATARGSLQSLNSLIEREGGLTNLTGAAAEGAYEKMEGGILAARDALAGLEAASRRYFEELAARREADATAAAKAFSPVGYASYQAEVAARQAEGDPLGPGTAWSTREERDRRLSEIPPPVSRKYSRDDIGERTARLAADQRLVNADAAPMRVEQASLASAATGLEVSREKFIDFASAVKDTSTRIQEFVGAAQSGNVSQGALRLAAQKLQAELRVEAALFRQLGGLSSAAFMTTDGQNKADAVSRSLLTLNRRIDQINSAFASARTGTKAFESNLNTLANQARVADSAVSRVAISGSAWNQKPAALTNREIVDRIKPTLKAPVQPEQVASTDAVIANLVRDTAASQAQILTDTGQTATAADAVAAATERGAAATERGTRATREKLTVLEEIAAKKAALTEPYTGVQQLYGRIVDTLKQAQVQAKATQEAIEAASRAGNVRGANSPVNAALSELSVSATKAYLDRNQFQQARPKVGESAEGRRALEQYDSIVDRLNSKLLKLQDIQRDTSKSFDTKQAQTMIDGLTRDVDKLLLELAKVGAVGGQDLRKLAEAAAAAGGRGGGLDGLGNGAERAGRGAAAASHGFMGLLGVLFQLSFVVGTLKGLGDSADKYIEMENRLRAFTGSEANLNAVTDQVISKSRELGVSQEALGQTYASLAIGQKALGASQRDLLGLSVELQEASKVEGSKGNENAAGSIVQLTRALTQAHPQARTLLSMLREYPILLQAISKAEEARTGKPMTPTGLAGEVKAKTLSGEQLYKDLQAGAKDVQDEFDRLTPTFQRGFQIFGDGMDTFLGKLAEGTGATRAFMGVMRTLANNMGLVALAAVEVGIGMAAAFGGSLTSALTRIWTSIVRINLALLANPFVALAAAILALVGLVEMFGDKIKVTSDGVVTLKGYFNAAFGIIVDWLKQAWQWLVKFMSGIDLGPLVNGIREAFVVLWQIVAGILDEIIGAFAFVVRAVVDTWSGLPGALSDIVGMAANGVLALWQKMQNFMIDGLNSVLKLADRGYTPIKHVDVKVRLYNPDEGKAKAYFSKLGADAGKSFGTAYVENAAGGVNDAIMRRAREDAARKGAGTIGTDETTPIPGQDPTHSKGKTPAEMIAEEQRKLKEAADAAVDFGDDKWNREAIKSVQDFAREFEDQFKGKKLDSGIEEAMIRSAIATERNKNVLDEYDKIVASAVGPARAYAIALDAINKAAQPQKDYRGVVQPPVIDEAQAAILRRDALKTQLEGRTKFNPEDVSSAAQLALINIQDEQAGSAKKLQAAMEAVYKTYGEQSALDTYKTNLQAITRDFLAHVISVQEATKALRANETELARAALAEGRLGSGIALAMREQRAANDNGPGGAGGVQREKLEYDAYTKAVKSANDGLRELAATQRALLVLMNSDPINKGLYARQLTQARIQESQLNVELGKTHTFLGVMGNSLLQLGANFKGVMPTLNASFQTFFTTLEDGFANGVAKAIVQGKSLAQIMRSVLQEAVEGLISSLIKMGIQWLINAAIGKSIQASANATAVGTATATGSAVAAALAPAALLESIVTGGAADVTGLVALSSAMSTATVLGGIMGHASGGPISGPGTGTSDSVLAWLSNGEYVVNARAANDNMGLLEAINSGSAKSAPRHASGGYIGAAASASSGLSQGGAGTVNVHVENHHPTANIQVERMTSGDVRIIAREEAVKAVHTHTPGVIEREINNPNSRSSKSLARNLNTDRKRA